MEDTFGTFYATEHEQTHGAALRREAVVLLRLLRRHALFVLLTAVAATVRVVALIAYRPALEFAGDSYAYLHLAASLRPDPVRPAGYPLFLRALSVTGELAVVPAVQHIIGLALGIAVYLLLTHRGVAGPVAAVAVAPVLLDAYQVNIEHFVMAEALFEALMLAGLVALLWAPTPTLWACGFAGGCFALASLVRTVGVVVGLLALAYVIVRRFGWSRSLSFAGMLAAPLIAYAVWFHSANGSYALTGGDAYWLYGRVAPIADCTRLDLDPVARRLCSPHPPGERPGPNYYVWNHNSPRFTLPVAEEEKKAVLSAFAHQVITRQPGDYAWMVAGEVTHYFAPDRRVGARDWHLGTWQFPAEQVPPYWNTSAPLISFGGERVERDVAPGPATFLRIYQRHGFTPGPVLGAALLLGVAAAFARGRRRGERRVRADCALLVTAGMALLVVPSATVCFDYRYLLPTLVLFPPAAALGWHSLARPGRTRAMQVPGDVPHAAGRRDEPGGREPRRSAGCAGERPTPGKKDFYDQHVSNRTYTRGTSSQVNRSGAPTDGVA